MSEKTITTTDKKQLIKAEKLKIQILKTADMPTFLSVTCHAKNNGRQL